MKAMETTATAGLVQAGLDFSLATKWIAFAQVKPASVKSYEKGIKRFREYFAAKNIATPTREVMIAYRSYLGENYKPSTANLYITAARLFLGFLQQEGYLKINPAEHIKGFKIDEGHKKSALAASDVKEIAAKINTSTLKGSRDKAMFALMTSCGLRCCEVARANVGDFEIVDGVIRLHILGKGRDEKIEAVNVPGGVYNLIQNWLAARGTVADDAPLFSSVSRNNFGGRLTTVSISRIVKGLMKAADYDSPRLTAHSLRHTAATTALKSGATLREVQETLRHRNISVTQIYLHELDALANSATNRAATAFGF